MAGSQFDGEVVAVGTWLYGGTTKCMVEIVKTNIAYGSGDIFDPPEIREDRIGTFYHLTYYSPTDATHISAYGGFHDTIELAKSNAAKMCPNLTWK